jgi:hypothetical protein
MFYIGLLVGIVIGCFITVIILAIVKEFSRANKSGETSALLHKKNIKNNTTHDTPLPHK